MEHTTPDPASGTPLKTCTRCGRELPATTEWFHLRGDTADLKFRAHCRQCHNLDTKEWIAAHPETRANQQRIRENAKQERANRPLRVTKACTKCGTEYPATEEFFVRNGWSVAGKPRLRSWCKPCLYDDQRKRRETHRELAAKRSRDWRQDHPEWASAAAREWREAHPDIVLAYSRKRRAQKLGNGGEHSAADVRAQYTRQHGRCFYCGRLVGDTYHVDHVIPLAKGGSNGPENIVVACPTCNLRKKDKHPMDFCGRMF